MKSGDLLDKIRSFFELAGEWRKTGIKGNNFTSNPSFGLSGESGTKNWLHPALLESGEKIETSVSVFRKRIFVLLRKYGKVRAGVETSSYIIAVIILWPLFKVSTD